MTAVPPRIPLPKGYFGTVQLTLQQEAQYREIVHKSVANALLEEREFVRNGRVDLSQWRQVKQKQGFQIFRRKKNAPPPSVGSRHSGSYKQASMMGYGRVEGTLDDILYGWYDKSHEEMQVTMSYVDGSTADCTVLHMIETATPDDPFNYIGVKWVLSKLPIVRARDLCYIDAMGCRRDERGDRYGYVVMHSVDVPNCPIFHRNFAVRAEAYFTFIMREHRDGSVHAFSHGYFDAAGEMIQHFSTIATSEILSTMFQSVKCGEAKKLTVLAGQKEAEYRLAKQQQEFDGSAPTVTMPSTDACCICRKRGGMFSALKICRICSCAVCSSCRVKKKAFTGPNNTISKVNCCPTCLVAARNMEVRPSEEEFSILTDQYLLQHKKEVESERSHSRLGNSVGMTELSVDDYNGSEYTASEYTASEYEDGGVSEEVVEATIDLMLQRKQIEEQQARPSFEMRAPMGYQAVGPTGCELISAHPAAMQMGPYSQSYTLPPRAHTVDIATLEKERLFQQMLALQSQSKQVAAMTRANQQHLGNKKISY